MPTTTTKKQATQQRTLEELADLLVPTQTPDIDEAFDDDENAEQAWLTLCEEIRGGPIEWRAQRIMDALPASSQADFKRYESMQVSEEAVIRKAAYLLGVAIGRRLAGGVR
jgi:hypothetical protein